jgi:hypothetical protein
VNATRPEWSSFSGGNRLPLLRILGRARIQVNVQRDSIPATGFASKAPGAWLNVIRGGGPEFWFVRGLKLERHGRNWKLTALDRRVAGHTSANLPRVPIWEAPYCQMDAVRYATPHSVQKRKGPFTPPEPRAIFLLQNRRPNAPDGRAIEEPCPSRVFVSKYLRRKIDKLNFLQPNWRRKRSVRGTWC